MDLFLCYIWKAILFGIDNRCGQFEKSEKGMYFENIRYKASVSNTGEGGNYREINCEEKKLKIDVNLYFL